MGQNWIPVNLDKLEYVNPHELGTGLKLWEQLANSPGTGAALIILTAAMPEMRGGGDFDLKVNYHGSDRDFSVKPTGAQPLKKDYIKIAKRTIGRWAGNRIAIVGDYAENNDLSEADHASLIYRECDKDGSYKNITSDVSVVIEHELQRKFTGDGYKDWTSHKI